MLIFIRKLLGVYSESLLIGFLICEGVFFEEVKGVGFGIFDDVADGQLVNDLQLVTIF